MKYDVIVVGGGTGGVASAVSYAKSGFKVAIVEKQNSLGGTQTNGLVTPFMPSSVSKSNIGKLILDNYQKYDSDNGKIRFGQAFSFNPEIFKYSLDRLCSELCIDIYYDSICIKATADSGTIKSIECMNAFNSFELTADIFIDATANLQLGTLAGAKIQPDTDKRQAVSLRFEIANIDFAVLKTYLETVKYSFCPLDCEYLEFVYVPESPACLGLKPQIDQAIADGVITKEDARYIQGFTTPSTEGLLSFNGPQLPNKFDVFNPREYSEAIIVGREMQRRLHNFLKLYIPGFRDSFISKSASMLGIRESRRLAGVCTPSSLDYANRQKDITSIARGDWYIDIHNDDLDVESPDFKKKYEVGEYYDIPYGSLVCEELNNYICIGRHISTTFEIQSSTRIQHTIYMMADQLGSLYKFCLDSNTRINDTERIRKEYYEK